MEDNNNNNNDEISKYKQFTCSECDRVPEILKIHKYKEEGKNDEGKKDELIELKCKYHGYKTINLELYEKNLKNFILSCNECKNIMQSKGDIKYCIECQKKLCKECLYNYSDNNNDKKGHKTEHKNIAQEDKNNKCLQHYNNPITSYCKDCEENFCAKDKEHDSHETIKLDTLKEETLNNIENIEKKNIIINNLIKDYGNFRENKNIHLEYMFYNYRKLIKQYEIKPKEFDIIKYRIEKLNNSDKNIKKYLKEKNIKIKIDDETLFKTLSLEDKGNKKINNEEFKLITKLYIKNLKEIDLSDNKISDIDCLNQMILPHLESLNMSKNEIQKIDPIIDCIKLRKIDFSQNKISDIKCLSKELPHLESLNMSKNEIQKIDPIIDCIKLRKIDFSHNKISDIKCLNNEILPYLESLNMSNNKIVRIEALSDYKKIKEIDVSNNYITSIFSKFEFLDLKKINLKGNSLNKKFKKYIEFKNKYKDIIED